jgi:GcrA cell cycle regulator
MVDYFRWQQEHDDYLRHLAANGLSSAMIVDELHKKFRGVCKFTRNSVIGRAHRLKIGLKANKKTEIKKVKTETKIIKEKPETKIKVKPLEPKRVLFLAPIEEIFPEEKPKLSILDLGPNQCRYTASEGNPADFDFCGKPTQIGRSYCDNHYDILYYKRSAKSDEGKAA